MNLKNLLIEQLVKALLASLTPGMIRHVLEKGLAAVEEQVKESKTEYDDMVVLPVIAAVRNALLK